jgi:hypothetical protein
LDFNEGKNGRKLPRFSVLSIFFLTRLYKFDPLHISPVTFATFQEDAMPAFQLDTMKLIRPAMLLPLALLAAALLLTPVGAAAHCDTLDGPVVQDARKALESKDVTPVLKWVRQKDENAVRAAFLKALHERTKGTGDAGDEAFFATVVKVHRAAEGAQFTGLKATGTVEPVIAEADRALESGSADAVIKMVTDEVAAGIKERHQRAAEAYRHKDESVAKGREFVAAYVEYTHYIEHLHQLAAGEGGGEEHGEPTHSTKEKKHVK